MRTISIFTALATSLACAACIPPPAAGTATTSGPVSAASADGTVAPAATTEDDGAGPPAIRRMIPGQEAPAAAPFVRGDYLIALDYRDEGQGTYGFLYHGDNQWWFVENDELVGGPYVDGGPEMQRVTAAWRDFETRRHQTVMNGIAAMPRGCLDGCAFDVYQNGQYAGTRIEY
jgi:hypothetical protein